VGDPEGNITASANGQVVVASPEYKSLACKQRYCMNMGDPLTSSSEVLMDEPRKRRNQDELKEVRCPIVLLKAGNAAGGKGTRLDHLISGHTQADTEPSRRVTTKRYELNQR
jgi:hypothetical protein